MMSAAPRVWVIPGMLVSYGEMVDTAQHAHALLQLTVFEDSGSLLIDGQLLSSSLLASNVAHRLQMKKGWVILVEPQSEVGRCLQQLLVDNQYQEFAFSHELLLPSENHFPLPQVIAILQQLSATVDWQQMLGEVTSNDPRIERLLTQLNQCFASECLKPDNWRAEQIAEQLALSESRFLHLFKQQMGIAWRPYLLWRRLICAVKLIREGESATEAAHRAGFSDSAHLSRTFKSIFGVSIRESKAMFFKQD
ncbi:helix-turn-helix transcriptional regulator [Vibrio rhodolitus]|uniref:helix-turn-helix transcriptional regulator n=1 Tax=Vibrio rhodolitus TaxID=2231649 RepID=UPI000E0A3B09|nr:helix-turn-helix transcriptional regulator [Vibrio rhodolitus]